MKKIGCLLIMVLCLAGCTETDKEIDAAMQLREQILSGESSFLSKVTTDYGDSMYVFSMECVMNHTGTLQFEMKTPDSLAGITGTISDDGGNITFDEKALYFPLLTDDLLVPASAPWILMKTLRGGYITAACSEENLLHLTINDSYADDALMVDIWLDEERLPVRGDILHEGKRILSIDIEGFRIV